MHAATLLLVAGVVGVDYGWQQLDGGQIEYIIQVEPALLASLAEGQPIFSEIHPDVRGVRRFRIQVGSGVLPKEGIPREPAVPAIEPPVGGGFVPPPEPKFAIPGQDNSAQRDTYQPIQPPLVAPPREFASEPPSEPLVRPTGGFREVAKGDLQKENGNTDSKQRSAAAGDGEEKQNTMVNPSSHEASPPWIPLVVTAFLLFASIGGNVYLGWIARTFYLRCRALAREARTSAPQPEAA